MAHKDEHLAELLRLDPDQQLEAANTLLDSLDADSADPNLETAWAVELRLRLDGLASGERESISAEDVFAQARARFD